MGTIKDRIGMDLPEAKRLRRGGNKTQKNCTEKVSVTQINVVADLEPDFLECEFTWALGRISTNKASGGHRIPAQLFQILKDDAVKGLQSIFQPI